MNRKTYRQQQVTSLLATVGITIAERRKNKGETLADLLFAQEMDKTQFSEESSARYADKLALFATVREEIKSGLTVSRLLDAVGTVNAKACSTLSAANYVPTISEVNPELAGELPPDE
jgi:alpha-galactosidase